MAPVTVRPQDLRRARRFAAALEGGSDDVALVQYARLAGAIGPSLAVGAPAEDFRLALRNRLLAVGAVGVAPVPAFAPATPWRRRLVAAGAVLAISTGGVAATAVASSDALPGDRLYEVKRAVEQVQLALAGSELDKAKQYLTIAATRLAEVQGLLARNPAAADDPALVQELRDTLSAASSSLAEGAERFFAAFSATADATVLAPLEAFLAERGAELAQVRGLLPVELLPKQDSLIGELEVIAARVADATGRSALPTAAAISSPLAERPGVTARASRTYVKRAPVTIDVDKTVHDIDAAVAKAQRDAEKKAAQAAKDAEKQQKQHAEMQAQMEQDVSKLVEVELMGEKGAASVGAVDGLGAGHKSVSTGGGPTRSAGSNSGADAMLLSLLPLPDYSIDTAIPGSLTAGLDFSADRLGGKRAHLSADR